MKGHFRQASLSVPAQADLPQIADIVIIRPMRLK